MTAKIPPVISRTGMNTAAAAKVAQYAKLFPAAGISARASVSVKRMSLVA